MPLQDFQLCVELADFVRLVVSRQCFLPFGKRALEKGRRTLVVSELQIYIAEMPEHCRIVFLAIYSSLQIFLRLGKLVLLVISPAQAVEVGAVVRIFLQGPLDKRDGLIKPYATVRQNIA